VVLVLGGGAWFFFKRNTKRGANTVRAFVYMSERSRGASVEDANKAANYDVANGPVEIVRQAMDCVRVAYGGSQLALIAEAKQAGFVASSGHTKQSAEPATDADWVRPFALYYLASEMAYVSDGDMPRTVGELVFGQPSDATMQSLLVALQNYLSFAYGRDRHPDDVKKATLETQIVARAELQVGNSILVLKNFVRRMHTNADGTSAPEYEIEAALADAIDKIRTNSEMGGKLRALILKDSINQLFEAQHQMPATSYVKKVLEHYEATT
jgi:hypothetical protein